jgi:deltex
MERTIEITGCYNIKFHQIKSEIKQFNASSMESEKCSICQCEFGDSDRNIVRLSRCAGHYFHLECIHDCRQGKEFIKCPNCMRVYGIQTGSMPSGTMKVAKRQGNVPGFNCTSYIEINYKVESIIISGKFYAGTSRTAYLPDTEEGNQALTLLTIAFQRGLTFTPGTSVTSGADGIIWAIHHKTVLNGPNYGYPDSTYLKRLIEELNSRGVAF